MYILVQARINSSRLPGKVLKKCAGKPILKRTIERLKKTKYKTKSVIITSKNKSDDPIIDFCKNERISYFRGPLDDVVQRYIEAAEYFKCKNFIRISGDSPLIDPNLVDRAISIGKNHDYDLISNILKRTFPKGQSIEIISLKALQKLVKNKLSSQEREHVTLGFYNRQSNFKILDFSNKDLNYSEVQLSIDTQEDFFEIENLLKTNKQTMSLGWEELAKIKNNLKKKT